MCKQVPHGAGALLCRVSGLRGTGALLLAYLLHVDAFGSLHWNAGDLAVGLAFAAPMICLGAQASQLGLRISTNLLT